MQVGNAHISYPNENTRYSHEYSEHSVQRSLNRSASVSYPDLQTCKFRTHITLSTPLIHPQAQPEDPLKHQPSTSHPTTSLHPLIHSSTPPSTMPPNQPQQCPPTPSPPASLAQPPPSSPRSPLPSPNARRKPRRRATRSISRRRRTGSCGRSW